MKIYEVTREIYNPCANQFYFDTSFPEEIETDNIEESLKKFLGTDLPPYDKEVLTSGVVVYTLKLPRMERYTFSQI